MTRPTKVVVVDDTPQIRVLVRLMLETAGFEVVGEGSDGAEGIALVEALEPDVVLLDISMPVMDGLHAIPLMRGASPQTAIVVLTGFDGLPVEEALTQGAVAAVQKTSDLETLPQAIRDALNENLPAV